MADLSDVQNALVAVAAQALYPAGTAQPSAAGAPCRIYAGWPVPASLDADLAAGVTHVTVFPRDEERNTTRFPADWQTLSTTPPALTLTVGGQTVTVGGAVAVPQNAVVLANGQPYVYALQGGDTLSSVATALAALIAVDIPGTVSSGAVVTLPTDAHGLAARVGVHGVSIREIRRQVRHFQFTVWSDTPFHRDAVAQPVDVALAAIKFLTLADGMAARLIYQ
ncbi:MAG TPA: hypothetical protein DEP05_07970, partial [Betaproteobacteria bacterium]|nr:hypothetical protein [Betaproteobacteria bacterium]